MSNRYSQQRHQRPCWVPISGAGNGASKNASGKLEPWSLLSLAGTWKSGETLQWNLGGALLHLGTGPRLEPSMQKPGWNILLGTFASGFQGAVSRTSGFFRRHRTTVHLRAKYKMGIFSILLDRNTSTNPREAFEASVRSSANKLTRLLQFPQRMLFQCLLGHLSLL